MYTKSELVNQLKNDSDLSEDKLRALLESPFEDKELFEASTSVRKKYYGTDVYVRGLIEFTNYCKNNCYYCGIRRDNKEVNRYRLSKDEILECADEGYELGFRTFVLQGGEDAFFDDETMCDIVRKIKERHSDCAITLSLGERSFESYKKLFDAGAERYLLRHETASKEHYLKLHPKELSLSNRKQCLFDLKEIGYQVGSGFMVGSPYQTTENLIEDIRFLQELKPDMIGIGPFISHKNTPFLNEKSGTLEMTLRMIAVLRLVFPYALIPATTALGTINPKGRELGLLAGANVVMPNLSPVSVRKKYELYDDKICTGEESAQCRGCLENRVKSIGYEIVTSRGDVKRI